MPKRILFLFCLAGFWVAAALGQTAPDSVAIGRVLDAKGNPIPNAQITVWAVTGPTGVRFGKGETPDGKISSGRDGEFVIRRSGPFNSVTVTAEAPGFARGVFAQVVSGGVTNELRLAEGVSVHGTLLKSGTPVAGVKMGISDAERGSEIYHLELAAETDAQGHFVFSNLPPRHDYFFYGVMNSLKGVGAVATRRIAAGPNGTSVELGEITIEPSFTLDGRIRLTDSAPLPEKTTIRLGRDGPHDFQDAIASADGTFHFDSVPAEVVSVAAAVPGHRSSMRNGSLFPPKPIQLLGRVSTHISGLILEFEPGEMLPPLNIDPFALREEPLRGAEGPGINGFKVAGSVTDVGTKKGIKHFSLIEGRIRNGRTNWFPTRRQDFTNGQFTTYFPAGDGYLLQIESENYLPSSARAVGTNLNIRLQPGIPTRGVVIKPNGKPAANVTVYLADLFNGLQIEGPPLSLAAPANDLLGRAITDSNGAFTFSPGVEDFAVLIVDAAGFAYVRVDELRAHPEVKLQPWARVEGKLMIADQPGTNEVVRLTSMPRPFEWYPRELPAYTVSLRTRTDGDGQFIFEQVPPVLMEIAHSPSLGDRAPEPIEKTQTQILPLKPGETARVDLGGQGRLVTGRVVITNFNGVIRWNFPALALETIREGGPSDAAMKTLLQKLVATSVANAAPAARDKAERDYQAERSAFARATREYYQTEKGATNWLSARRFLLQFDDEGKFWAVDVPPGKYRIHWMISKNTGLLIAEGDTDVTVPSGKEPLDIGVIQLGARIPNASKR